MGNVKVSLKICDIFAGGHRDTGEERKKIVAAQKIAIERAQMRARLERK